jgi:protein-tyrosine sulfotransferase
MSISKKLKKTINFSSQRITSTLARDAHKINIEFSNISKHVFETSKKIRGASRKPALMIHGVASRSGTNFLNALLRLHPDLFSSPNDIFEMHFLTHTNHLLAYEHDFFASYARNKEKIGKHDFLPLFGASFVAYLHSFVPEHQRILSKVASSQYLRFFPHVFPHEQLLIIIRDGRDVVHSTMKTWPQSNFSSVCKRWRDGVRLILSFIDHYKDKHEYWMVRFEDVVVNPEKFVKEACERYQLDESKYPFSEIDELPVIGSSKHSKKGDEISWDPIKRPKDFKPVGRWKTWPEKRKKKFKKIAGQALIEAGYSKNLDW